MERQPFPVFPTARRTHAPRTDPGAGSLPVEPRPDHRATVRVLQRVALAATVVATGVLGGLVVTHPVGSSTTPTGASAPSSGAGVSGAATGPASTTVGPSVTAADPFFDSGAGSAPAPVFSFGGGGPALRSSGS